MTPGLHRFDSRGVESSSAPQNLYVAPGSTVPLLFEVLPARATIKVTAADAGTLIYLDNIYVGKGSWQGYVTPGRHSVVMRKANGELLQQALNAAPGMNYAIRDNPSPKPSVEAPALPAQPAVGQPLNPAAPLPNAYAAASSSPYVSPSGAPVLTAPSPVPGSATHDTDSKGGNYRGITGAVFAPLILGGPSTNAYNSHCPATEYGGSCSTGGPRGGALAVQLGYSYGWIAPEAMLGMSLDISSGELQLPPDLHFSWDVNDTLAQIAGNTKFLRLGILAGAGARVSTQAQGHRFSFSGVLGIVKRHIYVIPDSFFGSKPSYTAPTLFFDGGVMLGDSPGVKIYAGLFLWLEFVPSLTIERDVTALGLEPQYVPGSLKTITPYSGVQVMLGPMVGVTFGH